MCTTRSEFVFGLETECLTVVPGRSVRGDVIVRNFFNRLGGIAPSLPAYNGIFNAYGRCYFDIGHVELATSECASPYTLPTIADGLQFLAAGAAREIAADNECIILANNNHSGLLTTDCPIWGTHENFLIEQRPDSLDESILPFLVTRIYAGAGGITYPGAQYVASVRAMHMIMATGGGTTEARAIHSTAGRPHHASRHAARYRYHLICGDGHRSQFNCALQAGATALAVKAVIHDDQTRAAARRAMSMPLSEFVPLMRYYNVLAADGASPRVNPAVIATQRIYLDGARRFAARLDPPPEWIDRLLNDWEATLDAMARMDRAWLAARLDAFAKYELFSAVLADAGCSWSELPGREDLFHELALLNQNYHLFSKPDSLFQRLEDAGALRHRVAPRVNPGEEDEPFVPATGTRAEARARFIKEHRQDSDLLMSWTCVRDTTTERFRDISDPFAREYGPWEDGTDQRLRSAMGHSVDTRTIRGFLLHRYDRGRFRSLNQFLDRIEDMSLSVDSTRVPAGVLLGFRAWSRPRVGYLDGPELLAVLHRDRIESWRSVSDHCNVLRYTGLSPNIESMLPWIERGRRLLATADPCAHGPVEALSIREHAAAALTAAGLLDQARDMLRLPPGQRTLVRRIERLHCRFIAVRGEICRKSGNLTAAARLLNSAYRKQAENGYHGQLVNYTLPALAKCATTRQDAIGWLDCADATAGTNDEAPVDQLRIAVLRCRIAGPGRRTSQIHQWVRHQQESLPTLRECPALNRIIDHWDAWVAGEMLDGVADTFWGV